MIRLFLKWPVGVLMIALLADRLSTPVAAMPAEGYQLPGDAVEVRFDRIVDGDTFHADVYDSGKWTDETIRLIGVDAPETSDAFGNHPECFGVDAKNYANTILSSASHIWLEEDVDPLDPYGRQLRYVWYQDPQSGHIFLLNEDLAWNGYAVSRSYPPNTTRQDLLDGAEDHASANGLGMWSACSSQSGSEPTPTAMPRTPTPQAAPDPSAFCSLFTSADDAQQFLEKYPQVAAELDSDGNGRACDGYTFSD